MKLIPSLKLTARTWKWMVGRLLSIWEGPFSGAMSVLGCSREGTCPCMFLSHRNMIIQEHSPPPKDPSHSKTPTPSFCPILCCRISPCSLLYRGDAFVEFLQTEEDKKGFQIGNIFVQCLCSEAHGAFFPKNGGCAKI